jgi:hypothetical protein
MAGAKKRSSTFWENLNRNALASLRLASIRLMLRKLCLTNEQGSTAQFLAPANTPI